MGELIGKLGIEKDVICDVHLGKKFSYIGAATIGKGRFLKLAGNNQVDIASNDSEENSRVLGVNREAGSTNDSIPVVFFGITEVQLETGLSPVAGDYIYLSANGLGRLDPPPEPAIIRILGVITDSSQYVGTSLDNSKVTAVSWNVWSVS